MIPATAAGLPASISENTITSLAFPPSVTSGAEILAPIRC